MAFTTTRPLAPLPASQQLAAPVRPCSSSGRSCRTFASPNGQLQQHQQQEPAAGASSLVIPTRRDALLYGLAAAAATVAGPRPASAIQGLTAGRIPGLSKEPDASGMLTYTRPEGKSGGHGVGWSEIPQYTFKVPAGGGWDETPVSIADLGGTEIDLRYSSKDQGEIAVVVAPVLRFMDIGFNARISLSDVGPPDRVIAGFAPELFGKPLDEGDVLDTIVKQDENGVPYYFWELKPHNLVAATATKNRVFLLTVQANARQWKKHAASLRLIRDSFKVPTD